MCGAQSLCGCGKLRRLFQLVIDIGGCYSRTRCLPRCSALGLRESGAQGILWLHKAACEPKNKRLPSLHSNDMETSIGLHIAPPQNSTWNLQQCLSERRLVTRYYTNFFADCVFNSTRPSMNTVGRGSCTATMTRNKTRALRGIDKGMR